MSNVLAVHDEMKQADRDVAYQAFVSGSSQYLLVTDSVASEIDLQEFPLVINYDMPCDNITYIQRVGRSGRFGHKIVAINLVSTKETSRLSEIEKLYSTRVEEMTAHMVVDKFEDMGLCNELLRRILASGWVGRYLF